MATIGTISINMDLAKAKFDVALKQTRTQLETFKATAAGFAKDVGGALSRIGTATAALGTVALGSLAFFTKGALDSIDAAGDAAARIGTTTQALTALRYAVQLTGSEAENLDPALSKMNLNLSDAARGSGPASDALARLGLNAQELVSLDPALAFKQIADQISRIPNPADRASAAMDLLGKPGLALLNTLSAGSDEIARLEAEAKRLGVTFTDFDASQVGAANDALDRMGFAFGGLINQVAIQLAPLITTAIEKILAFAGAGGTAGEIVGAAIDNVVEVLSRLAGVANIVWQGMKIGITIVLTAATALVGTLLLAGKAIEGIALIVTGAQPTITKSLENMTRDLAKLTGNVASSISDPLNGADVGANIRKSYEAMKSSVAAARIEGEATKKTMNQLGEASIANAGKISQVISKLKEQRDTFGLTSAQSEIYRLKQLGASTATIAEASAITQQIEAMDQKKKRFEKATEEANRLIESSRTPLEKYKDELDQIADLQAQGLLTDKEAAAARLKSTRDNSQRQENPFSAALELGSKEARSAVLKFTQGGSKEDGIQDVARSSRETLAVNRKAYGALERMAHALDAPPAPAYSL